MLHAFSDNVANMWPVIVVTNPKPSRLLAPDVEPVQKIRNSSEIRVLAFSPHTIVSVEVEIVGGGGLRRCTPHPTVPDLYTVAWAPQEMASAAGGGGRLTVRATDTAGNSRSVDVEFSVEFGQLKDGYSLYARLILMGDVITVLQTVWVVSLIVSLLPIVLGMIHIHCYSFLLETRYLFCSFNSQNCGQLSYVSIRI